MSKDIPHYRGRFAPSPTGPLHFGSLIAAVASYCQARRMQGDWLVRIEDVDETRTVPGSADDILRTLDNYGFEWDDEVLYQTHRKPAYEEALQQLLSSDLIYRCICSRKDLQEQAKQGELGFIYPGFCASKHYPENTQSALRIRTQDQLIEFEDQIMGLYGQNLKQQLGDFIVRRRDGLFAYQLAVVVDDECQQITEIIRGSDLLDSTPRQIYLQQQLNFSTPAYAHLPIAINQQGDKLSKQTGALAIHANTSVTSLVRAMDFLGQCPESGLKKASLSTFWQWAMEYWDIGMVPDTQKILYTS
ncbi:MAG: tRNA glutamyl-Q(34) synthetase GluQRS [Gammaproteobacteria bacterium]|nr:tRNA glutamyl-Q(34) synthetase GluQRS [Gammaproteobacteria bacterium]MCW9005570.1 tRNA glutamyl-Q(34) synthetase GluQRS [Gammaproteobacteria bacterium]